ncbi:MAG: RAMP superfamily CRISPR-associated protein, partial [Pirellula sp.]|nr:RAMP superfamily CRISPR-associated protein [Pirellula sp.]
MYSDSVAIGRAAFALALSLGIALPPVAAGAADWPEFRGPNQNGTVTAADAPITWSEEKNVVWYTPTRGLGWSSPVIVDDRIYVTSARNTKSNDGDLSGPQTPLLPYGFVPIDVESAITDKPVWHDGSCPDLGVDNSELLSGELRCTLTALTPLLPGNARYPVRKDGKADSEFLANPDLLKQWGFENLKPGKQIAEPLRLPDGRVVIPGSALKGMIRHSLGALLSAPMERVGERHYTYRPNLDLKG